MDGIERARFDHIGVITEERHDGEVFVDATRVWVTNPRDHPFHVEYLRFEPDTHGHRAACATSRTSPTASPTSTRRSRATSVLLAPFEVGGGFCRVAFVLIDGAVVEFMQYANPDEEGWF